MIKGKRKEGEKSRKREKRGKKEKKGKKGESGIKREKNHKGTNYDKILYLRKKIYFPPIFMVPSWGNKYHLRKGRGGEMVGYDFWVKY